MDFGLGPIAARAPPEQSLDHSEVYERTIELGRSAESAGFDSVWVAEHHFAEDGYLPSPTALAGGLATCTDSLTVGAGIAIAPLHHPIRIAEDAAVIDNMASSGGGRFKLGVGLGYRDIEYEGLDVERKDRVAHLRDTLDVCRDAWSDGPIDVDGRRHQFPSVDVTPKPATDLPILVGANVKAGIERAARHADGFLALFNLSIEELDSRLTFLQEVLEEEGQDPSEFDLQVFRTLYLHEDGEQAAWETMKEGYLYERRKYLKWYLETQDSHLDVSEDEFEEKVAEAQDEWREWAICGTPQDIVEELERVSECWDGEVSVISQLHYTGMDFDTTKEAVELFGDEVIPQLRSI